MNVRRTINYFSWTVQSRELWLKTQSSVVYTNYNYNYQYYIIFTGMRQKTVDLEELLRGSDRDAEAVHTVEHGGVGRAGVGVSVRQPGVEGGRVGGESEAGARGVQRHALHERR